jgi:ribosomal protein L44E
MDEDAAKTASRTALCFECESCGERFETWDRLRQHQIDCQPDDFDMLA